MSLFLLAIAVALYVAWIRGISAASSRPPPSPPAKKPSFHEAMGKARAYDTNRRHWEHERLTGRLTDHQVQENIEGLSRVLWPEIRP